MDEDIFLREPSIDDKDEWLTYVYEMKIDNPDATPGGFKEDSVYEEWLKRINDESNSITHDDRVPSSFYFLVRGDRIIGSISIRHNISTPFLKKYGGHIGYNIRPSERRKGYATKMLYLALFKCLELGLEDIMVTCKSDNVASSKTIENNHGKFVDEVFIPEEDAIFKIYWINVDEALLKNDVGEVREYEGKH